MQLSYLRARAVDQQAESVDVGDAGAVTPGGEPATPTIGQVARRIEQIRYVLNGHAGRTIYDDKL